MRLTIMQPFPFPCVGCVLAGAFVFRGNVAFIGNDRLGQARATMRTGAAS
ncbi:hypothetical protein ACVBGC_09075 [Burkholderia stagnalis]